MEKLNENGFTMLLVNWHKFKLLHTLVNLLHSVFSIDNNLCFSHRAQGSIECEHLKNNVTLDCEKTEEKLMHR